MFVRLGTTPAFHDVKPETLSWIANALDLSKKCLSRLWIRSADAVAMGSASGGFCAY